MWNSLNHCHSPFLANHLCGKEFKGWCYVKPHSFERLLQLLLFAAIYAKLYQCIHFLSFCWILFAKYSIKKQIRQDFLKLTLNFAKSKNDRLLCEVSICLARNDGTHLCHFAFIKGEKSTPLLSFWAFVRKRKNYIVILSVSEISTLWFYGYFAKGLVWQGICHCAGRWNVARLALMMGCKA